MKMRLLYTLIIDTSTNLHTCILKYQQLLEFDAEVIDSIIDKLTVNNVYSISDLYKEMKNILQNETVAIESENCV